MSGAEPLAAPWPLAHPGALCPRLRLRLCLRLPQPPGLPSPGMQPLLLLSPSRPWTRDFRSGLGAHTGEGAGGSPDSAHLAPRPAPQVMVRAVCSCRCRRAEAPRRMAGDGASAAGGLPGDTGQGWRASLRRPLLGTQPPGTCDCLQKPPHLRGGEHQEGSARLTCSPGDSGHLSSVLGTGRLPSPSQALQSLSPLTSESAWKVPCLDLTQGPPK